MITAVFKDGPLKGTRVQVESLEGRPPMTLDRAGAAGGDACRYWLGSLSQGGGSAIYTFLYRV